MTHWRKLKLPNEPGCDVHKEVGHDSSPPGEQLGNILIGRYERKSNGRWADEDAFSLRYQPNKLGDISKAKSRPEPWVNINHTSKRIPQKKWKNVFPSFLPLFLSVAVHAAIIVGVFIAPFSNNNGFDLGEEEVVYVESFGFGDYMEGDGGNGDFLNIPKDTAATDEKPQDEVDESPKVEEQPEATKAEELLPQLTKKFEVERPTPKPEESDEMVVDNKEEVPVIPLEEKKQEENVPKISQEEALRRAEMESRKRAEETQEGIRKKEEEEKKEKERLEAEKKKKEEEEKRKAAEKKKKEEEAKKKAAAAKKKKENALPDFNANAGLPSFNPNQASGTGGKDGEPLGQGGDKGTKNLGGDENAKAMAAARDTYGGKIKRHIKRFWKTFDLQDFPPDLVVTLTFKVNRFGQLVGEEGSRIKLAKSSGNDALDEEAMLAVESSFKDKGFPKPGSELSKSTAVQTITMRFQPPQR